MNITVELTKFNVTDAAIAELSSKYMPLVVKDLDDKEGFRIVKEARIDVKKRRVEVEHIRKELKEEALRYGQTVDKEARRITALLTPIENHLQSEEDKIENEKARIKAEADAKEAARIQERVDRICALGAVFNVQTYMVCGLTIPVSIVNTCADEDFGNFINQAQAAKDAEEARLKAEEEARKAEAERVAKIAAEQEAERKRLESIAKEQAEKEAKVKAGQEALEREKQRLLDEKRHEEEMAKAKIEAAEKAKKETEERIKREAEEKTDKERLAKIAEEKKAARAPDKVKLMEWIKSFNATNNPVPSLKTMEAQEIMRIAHEYIEQALQDAERKAEAL